MYICAVAEKGEGNSDKPFRDGRENEKKKKPRGRKSKIDVASPGRKRS
jgi:hypothetical protein